MGYKPNLARSFYREKGEGMNSNNYAHFSADRITIKGVPCEICGYIVNDKPTAILVKDSKYREVIKIVHKGCITNEGVIEGLRFKVIPVHDYKKHPLTFGGVTIG